MSAQAWQVVLAIILIVGAVVIIAALGDAGAFN